MLCSAMLRIIKLLCSAFINCETEDCSPGNGVWRETMLCNWAISVSYQDSHFITNFLIARSGESWCCMLDMIKLIMIVRRIIQGPCYC